MISQKLLKIFLTALSFSLLYSCAQQAKEAVDNFPDIHQAQYTQKFDDFAQMKMLSKCPAVFKFDKWQGKKASELPDGAWVITNEEYIAFIAWYDKYVKPAGCPK